jgi:ASC-1-like (ASCH) protein
MTIYNKTLKEPWFSLIKLGLKTVEGRLYKNEFANMKKRDIIIFENNDFDKRKITVKITKIKKYNTFQEYLEKEKLENCLPGFDSINDGVDVYYKYYSKEDEHKYKVVAIRMKIVKN